MVGNQVPNCYIEGRNEFLTRIQVGANFMTWASAAPAGGTGYWQQGDICWNTAAASGGHPSYWQCTVAGDGASSTWAAHNL